MAGNGSGGSLQATAPIPPSPGISAALETPTPKIRRAWPVTALLLAGGAAVALLIYMGVKHRLIPPSAARQDAPAVSVPANLRTSIAVLPFKSEGSSGEDDLSV